MKKKIVVIGSGLAGSLICDELVNDCDVTLLELGEKDKIQYPKINFINKKFSEVKTFCIGAGGTTNLWHNGLIPINPDDIISDEFREVIFETKPYTNRAATNLYFKNDSYLNDYRNVQFEMNSIAKEIGVFKDGVDCLLYPKKYKRLYVDPKVSSLYGVADIEFIPKNGRIETVEYIKDSKRYSIKPEIIILCAGTLGTPLLVKKIISSLGLNNESVGKGLADHPLAFVGKVKFKSKFNKSMKKISMIDKGNYLCRTAIRLKSHCGTYTACAFFRPALTMENTLQIHKYKSLLGASRGINQIKSCFSIKLFHPSNVRLASCMRCMH